jgi:hypothetical protein
MLDIRLHLSHNSKFAAGRRYAEQWVQREPLVRYKASARPPHGHAFAYGMPGAHGGPASAAHGQAYAHGMPGSPAYGTPGGAHMMPLPFGGSAPLPPLRLHAEDSPATPVDTAGNEGAEASVHGRAAGVESRVGGGEGGLLVPRSASVAAPTARDLPVPTLPAGTSDGAGGAQGPTAPLLRGRTGSPRSIPTPATRTPAGHTAVSLQVHADSHAAARPRSCTATTSPPPSTARSIVFSADPSPRAPPRLALASPRPFLAVIEPSARFPTPSPREARLPPGADGAAAEPVATRTARARLQAFRARCASRFAAAKDKLARRYGSRAGGTR